MRDRSEYITNVSTIALDPVVAAAALVAMAAMLFFVGCFHRASLPVMLFKTFGFYLIMMGLKRPSFSLELMSRGVRFPFL